MPNIICGMLDNLNSQSEPNYLAIHRTQLQRTFLASKDNLLDGSSLTSKRSGSYCQDEGGLPNGTMDIEWTTGPPWWFDGQVQHLCSIQKWAANVKVAEMLGGAFNKVPKEKQLDPGCHFENPIDQKPYQYHQKKASHSWFLVGLLQFLVNFPVKKGANRRPYFRVIAGFAFSWADDRVHTGRSREGLIAVKGLISTHTEVCW